MVPVALEISIQMLTESFDMYLSNFLSSGRTTSELIKWRSLSSSSLMIVSLKVLSFSLASAMSCFTFSSSISDVPKPKQQLMASI